MSVLYASLTLGLLSPKFQILSEPFQPGSKILRDNRSPNNMPRIVELAAQISTSVAEVQELLTAQGVQSPSWAEDSPRSLPADVSNLQGAVLDATAELHELLLGPLMAISKFAAVRLRRVKLDLLLK